MNLWIPMFAQASARTTYNLAKLEAYADERWRYAVLLGICAAVFALVSYVYRRDNVELRPAIARLLLALRVGALGCALFFFLGLEKRTEREIVHNSRALLLVDTSQSMGLHDSDATAIPATPSRIDQVATALAEGTLLDELRQLHDVLVVRFDRENKRIVSLNKLPGSEMPQDAAANSPGEEIPGADQTATESIDWKTALLPHGTETRLGNALKRLIDEERATPVSAIILISDGGQNSGLDPSSAAELARRANIPIYTVGIGSKHRPVNVRISDLIAPSRAFPGDAFTLTGYIQAEGLAGRTITAELFAREASKTSDAGTLQESQRVTLGPDGEVTPLKFELSSPQPGRLTYTLRLDAPAQDHNARDDQQEADVEIVDRKTRVLIVAGGATREYRFLRNQLHRDKDVVVDVLLQSALPGISQDANKILDEFPSSKEEMYQYDAIVAFDPDWTQLDRSQVDLLEAWVAEEAGGLIAVAGPIHTNVWVRSPQSEKIRGLYPVEFQRRFSLLGDDQYGAQAPWPIEFTQEGLEAEFLWIEDSMPASQAAWASLPGVFGHYAVKGAKPGATVYGRFSNPETAIRGELPVYFAGHFYGSGRVFYLGSGELWRLRSLDDAYFEQFYTKLLRHVAQGRLLRGSTRGVLLVERDRYLLGDTAVVRAQLSDAQHEPLDLPGLTLQVLQPDSTTQTVPLEPDPSRKGMYSGQFTVLKEGVFRLDLPVPETIDEQLTRRIRVKVPDLERENPQRNDVLLRTIAESTEGRYYVGMEAAFGRTAEPLVKQLRDRKETTVLAGSPDLAFEENLMKWLLGMICGLLSAEWLIRRLCKLA